MEAFSVSGEIPAELYPVFVIFRDEAKEIRAEITADLLTLEAEADAPPPGLFERIVRNAHTLKGNASSLGLEEVAALLHSVESLLTGVWARDRRFDAATIDLVLFSVDEAFRRAEDVLTNRPDSGGIRTAMSRIEHMLNGVEDRPYRPVTLSTSAPPPDEGEDLLKIGASQFEGFSQVVTEVGAAGARAAQRAAECTIASRNLESFALHARDLLPPALAEELERIRRGVSSLERDLHSDARFIASGIEELRGGLQMLQLVQASSMLDPLRRAVHDHARRVGKEALLEIVGADASVDRRILQELRGAITHVLRNAVDHGVEEPSERAAAGKPARARIRLELVVDEATLELSLSDDGRGLDTARIRHVAVERGLLQPEAAGSLTDEDALELIWLAGFSTSRTVTETSGRGLGLDAVKDCVSKLAGRVEVRTTPGVGTTFLFRVPVSYARAT